jgi:hypothetical protein
MENNHCHFHLLLLTAGASAPVEPLRATAQLQPTKGSKTFGEATFEQVGGKVHAVIYVQVSSRAGAWTSHPRSGRLQLGRWHEHEGAFQSARQAHGRHEAPSGTRATCRR